MKRFTNLCSSHPPILVVSAALACALTWSAQLARADAGPVAQAVTTPAAQTGRGTVKGDRCNVRSRPSTRAEVVVQLNKGDTVDVLERKSSTEQGKPLEWLRISLPANAKCYVSAKHLTGGVVDADNLNVHCGPGGNYRDIGKLPKGTKVDVVGTKGEWTQIRPTPECSGWIAAQLVDVEPAPAPAASNPPANMTEVVTPAVAAPSRPPAPAAPSASVVNIDPDVEVAYVVKDGYLFPVTESNAPASYELRTREVDRLSFRMAYLESSETNLKKYEGKHVRISGNQRWRKGDRYPVITIERIDRVW
ncbi:MAG TPA: SH3 domain-containing protein [Verrucomicrobiae bacterium]|nr:SH3 domain-containing protein [Verrucomicrobiae bacterium]